MNLPCSDAFSLDHAREAMAAIRRWYEAVLSGKDPEPLTGEPWQTLLCEGVFVTLWTYPDRELRGCMGTVHPAPVGEQIWRSALQAAFNDPRFPPLQRRELDHVVLELSLLYGFERVSREEVLRRFQLGRHGILLELGTHRGLLLPEVADALGARRGEDMLRAVSRKAGLPEDAWESPYARIQIFESLRFMERQPRGDVYTF